jgi:hypothetical protein
MCVLLLLAAAGLYTTALNVVHYENGSGAATTWAPEPTAPCAAAGCAEPPASSPPDLSAAYARQVSSFPRSAGGYAPWFHALAPRGLRRALLTARAHAVRFAPPLHAIAPSATPPNAAAGLVTAAATADAAAAADAALRGCSARGARPLPTRDTAPPSAPPQTPQRSRAGVLGSSVTAATTA